MMKAKVRVGATLESNEDEVEGSAPVNIEESTNSGVREGNEPGEEEGIGNEEAIDTGKVGEGGEKVKLAEGFFEMEAIRRKRIRKGQLQYLIKWRDWPETANTWEPLENLQSCSDVIDAFEERLDSGKTSRKRKKKHGIFHVQHRKKQSRSYTTHKLPRLKSAIAFKSNHRRSTTKSNLAELPTTRFMENNDPSRSFRSLNQGDHNLSKKTSEFQGAMEYDPKLSELREQNSGNGNTNELEIHLQEQSVPNEEQVVEFPKDVTEETTVNDRRTGAKRRKSGSVKRFQKESANLEQAGTLNSDGKNMQTDNSEEESKNIAIVKIIKAIGIKASVVDDSQDLELTFKALRADGKETVVDNSFLKAKYPLLLVNFYEQYVKYVN